VNLNAGTQVMLVSFDINSTQGAVANLKDIGITNALTSGGTGTGLTGQYFDNMDFTGTTFSRTDATVNFNWGLGSPSSSIGADTFSVHWIGQVQAQHTQTYTFYVTGDDGVRLWVNGVLLINKWILQSATEHSGSIALTAGMKYDIKLEYYENLGDAVAQLRWSSANTPKAIVPTSQLYPSGAVVIPPPTGGVVGTGTGLTGQYFDNSNFTGASVSRTDATVNFNWGTGSPSASIGADTFSARWIGQVQAQHTQTYTFHVTGDDGVRLWVNGVLLINKWILQPATESSGSITLIAGQKYDIKLEYYENLIDAVVQLRWSSASTPKAIIPASQLYPMGIPAMPLSVG